MLTIDELTIPADYLDQRNRSLTSCALLLWCLFSYYRATIR